MAAPTPFPLIDLAGPPRERGRQYGEAAAARIHRSAEIYLTAFEQQKLGAARVRELVDTLMPIIDRFEPAYLDEMRGIAEGAHCPLEHIVVVNARTELLAEARRTAADPDGCTGAVVLPEASADGNLLHGQNWDWRAECADTGVVLRIARDDGPDVLTFTEAGGLARCGMNSAGVALTANFLGSDRDGRTPGVPLVLLRRRALESAHFALGIQTIYATPKWVSNNIMLSHAPVDHASIGHGAAVDIESAPDESFVIQPDNGLLVHANHFESPAALAKLKDTGLPNTPDSAYRAQRVRGLLAPKRGTISIDDLKAAFFDDFATPYAVCRPPRPAATGDNLSATVMMIVMKPAEGWMEICPLPALHRSFTRYGVARTSATALAAE
jgi:isopenicillin-N N-acyltransferase-like protein